MQSYQTFSYSAFPLVDHGRAYQKLVLFNSCSIFLKIDIFRPLPSLFHTLLQVPK